MKNKSLLTIILIFITITISACGSDKKQIVKENQTIADKEDKGYDLKVDSNLSKKAKDECDKVMDTIKNDYTFDTSVNIQNVVLSYAEQVKIVEIIAGMGKSVINSGFQYNMSNYKKVDSFLKNAQDKKKCNCVIYEVNTDGGITRKEFIYNGRDMYHLLQKYQK